MEIPKTDKERRELIKRLARGEPGDVKPGRPVSKEFWEMPRPKVSEGAALKALLDDREQGR